ncbi:hypothetical protein C8A01DRAFT_51206 [Parachaetomium inaequale]|uniref:Uncharacterized protein n=1 Tax=Parachaetomium inaequale TaxID=2588326 RepID=A0AAN6SLU0_9PEZI|nr:hypothetical protein C8A01DRAFT_51206 [Parachaetomium inaequale]
MAYPDFDISQWYNKNDLDYRTPELPYDSHSASPAPQDQPQRRRPRLPLLQQADWNPSLPYDEFPPTYIHYSIEWKILLKKGRLSKLTNDTEQNLVLAPGAFWDQTLKPKLQQLLAKKTPRNKCYELDETNVVVSLVAWSYLLRDGRAELLEEQEATGLTTVWKDVYSLMRCTGSLCQGTYCWRELDNRKHYKLDTSVLTKLIDYTKEGNMLRTHGDSLAPIYITNIIPARCNQDLVGWSTGLQAPKLSIPRPIDQSIYRYCEWLYTAACEIVLEEGLDLERLYYT